MSTFLGISLSKHEENILTGVIIDVVDETHASLSDEAVLHKLIDIVNERDELEFQLRETKKELRAVKKELSQMNQGRDIVSDINSSSKYIIAPTEELRLLCIKNNLFTCADNGQYERFFVLNENSIDFSEFTVDLGILASYAYECSEGISYYEVYNIFEKASKEYHSRIEKDAEDEIEK